MKLIRFNNLKKLLFCKNFYSEKKIKTISPKTIAVFLSAFLFFTTTYFSQSITCVNEWKTDKDLKSATLAFCVIEIKTNSVIAEYNAHQFVIPASTQKAITTSAALGILGANYRFETKIYYTGNFNKETGIIDGDVIIYGGGDPTLQSEYFVKDSSIITDKWATILKEKGVKEIKGKLIGDASAYERAIPSNWIWADINNYFGAAPCALNYNDNKFKIFYSSKALGTKATVESTFPNYVSKTYTINSNVICKGTEDEAFVVGDPYSFIKDVSGKIPPNKTSFEVEAVLPDPALLCAENLCSSLNKIGIKCNPKKTSSNYTKPDSTATKQLLFTHYSPSLDKIIFHTNLKSNNLYAESILRAVGKGSFYLGLDAIKNYWNKQGLDITELNMTDGSGLSRANTVSTFFQASMLCKITNDSVTYKVFNNSLPIAGKSGSMSNIGKGKFIEGNMRAKTGYINRARGYCGYVKTKKGKELAFSILFNNYNCSAKEAKIKIEKFLVELGEW